MEQKIEMSINVGDRIGIDGRPDYIVLSSPEFFRDDPECGCCSPDFIDFIGFDEITGEVRRHTLRFKNITIDRV